MSKPKRLVTILSQGETTMFEQAARTKLRFPYKGICSSEDLFDLTPQQLDSIFRVLNNERKALEQESLLAVKSRDTETLDLQLAIVRRVVEIKLAEQEDNKARREKAAQRQKLLAILANKQDEELQGKSVEEIQRMIDSL